MFTKISALAFMLACQQYGVTAVPTWPASTDELEDILFLNSGYRAKGFATPVSPCTKGVTAGRITAAEWVRTAFHDAISGNIYDGSGGLDGSIAWELSNAENAGNAFPSSVGMFAPFVSSRLSLADIIAASIYTATRSCGGPAVPIRGGRVDATVAGPVGFVPQPQNGVGIFKNQFARLGLDTPGMIQLVACGHSLGGVHASENPLIINSGQYPNDFATMDTTPSAFDTKIASEYVSGNTKNPLVVGKSTTNGRNSDAQVFGADQNVTIKAMQDATTFANACQSLFQKMIEVVPKGVTLTDPVIPYEVKPYDVQLTLLSGGTKIKFTGDIRIRTTTRTNIAQVQLSYKDRTGAAVSTPISTSLKGTASGFDDSFAFYGFSTEVPSDTSMSSFAVVVTVTGGAAQTFDNNGSGFKVDDTIIYQSSQSCLNGGKLTVVAAVRSGASSPNLQVIVKNAQASPNPVPSLSTATAAMATQSAIGSYQLYSADYTFSGSQASSATFGVFAGSSSDNYKNASSLPTACTPLSSATPTSRPSSTAFAFQGCYYDAGVPRALPASSSFDDTMTVEKCAAFCSTYQYFGLEYTRECYCGNARDATSTIQALSDCNMPCGGNSAETCGAGNRISLYKNNKYSPPVNPKIAGYDYKGCYSEGSAGRALSDTSTKGDNMTVESCAAFCTGATYFGVEYAQECYCGSKLNDGSTTQNATDCNMLCSGNTTEYCGAGNRLNVYQKLSSSNIASSTSASTSSSKTSSSTSPSKPSTTANTSTPTSTSSSALPSVSGYKYIGCLTDNVANRTLSQKSRTTSNNTYTTCASFCSAYQYFGVEYGAECYCANTLPSSASKNPDSDCSMPCAGDASTNCGGPARIAVFNSTVLVKQPSNAVISGYTYKGCYTDNVNARVLADAYFFDAAMTVEKCASNCTGSAYFGTEYGGECYCGSVLKSTSTKAAESECGMVCGGNGMEFCGAGNRLSVYQQNAGAKKKAARREKGRA